MIALDLVRLNTSIEPSVDRGEGNAQPFGEFLLADPIIETV